MRRDQQWDAERRNGQGRPVHHERDLGAGSAHQRSGAHLPNAARTACPICSTRSAKALCAAGLAQGNAHGCDAGRRVGHRNRLRDHAANRGADGRIAAPCCRSCYGGLPTAAPAAQASPLTPFTNGKDPDEIRSASRRTFSDEQHGSADVSVRRHLEVAWCRHVLENPTGEIEARPVARTIKATWP